MLPLPHPACHGIHLFQVWSLACTALHVPKGYYSHFTMEPPVLVGTVLLSRRHRGSYGPAIRAGEGIFPGPGTPIPALYCCGDSTFPGIGLPAVAASGAITANTLAPVWDHWKLLGEMGL